MKIGSIVKLEDWDEMEYYIVTDIEKFPTGDLYGVLQMYPAFKDSPSGLFGQSDLKLIANPNDFDYGNLLKIVQSQRERVGITGEPDYLFAVDSHYRKIFKEIHDVIEYHKIEDVDRCLDALNDLDILHKMFGDEAYLQLKEVVQKRLEELK